MTGAALLSDLSKWLAATSLSHTIQTAGWIIPALQTVHILCVAVLFSSAVLVDLRLWRLTQRDVPLRDVGRRFLPLVWPVVVVLLLTGSLLIVGEPRRSLLNDTFYIKMGLLAFALLLTGLLQWSLTSASGFWERDAAHRIIGRLAATASILAWSGIIFAGRFIAYTQT
jgi:uncharacterized membrane protein